MRGPLVLSPFVTSSIWSIFSTWTMYPLSFFMWTWLASSLVLLFQPWCQSSYTQMEPIPVVIVLILITPKVELQAQQIEPVSHDYCACIYRTTNCLNVPLSTSCLIFFVNLKEMSDVIKHSVQSLNMFLHFIWITLFNHKKILFLIGT